MGTDFVSLLRRVGPPALALVLWLPAASSGQSVRGTVVADADGDPVDGAFVILLSANGDREDAMLTEADGVFLLAAQRPGDHRVVVERIGYGTWTSGPMPLAADEVRTLTVRVPLNPVRLSELNVDITGARDCVADPADAVPLLRVWDEARKALETQTWAEAADLYRIDLSLYMRELDPRSLLVMDEVSESREAVRPPPFTSLEPRSFSQDGYVREEPAGRFFYAPDGTALLSDEFRRDHCFALTRDDVRGRPHIGISFEPNSNRTVPDIRGVLWIDEATAELGVLEYVYQGIPLPDGAVRELIGGRVEFERIDGSGPFIVDQWWIRGARPTRPLPVGDGDDGLWEPITGYWQVGGAVREVRRRPPGP